MAAAHTAQRIAKSEFLALMHSDVIITDAQLVSALTASGYNAKKATNMVQSYRALPVPAPAAAPKVETATPASESQE
jgi:hypothetical protein